MATFISTIKFTDQGMKAVGETTKRVVAIKSAAKKLGVKVANVYWTVGSYDGVLIFDAQGNVRTNTNRAYSASEMDQMLPKPGE